MKRSEMVQILAESWLENSGNFGELELEIADFFLRDLEKTGMLPPYRKKTEKEKRAVDAINQYSYCHRWEPENE